MAEPAQFEIFTDKLGKRRLKVKGRAGFPLTMLDGETPEEAVARYDRKRAEKQGQAPPPPGPEPAPAEGPTATQPAEERQPWERLGGELADKLKAVPNRPEGAKDPPPRERKRPATLKPRPSTAELQKVLEELLVLPAVPMGFPVFEKGPPIMQDGHPTGYVLGADGQTPVPAVHPRCEYCRDHFIQAGPQAAAELAKLSEQSEPLRRLLERLHSTWAMLTMGSVLAGYVMKPVMHHLAPEPVRQGLGPIVAPGMPEPLPKAKRNHRHAPSAPTPPSANGAQGEAHPASA